MSDPKPSSAIEEQQALAETAGALSVIRQKTAQAASTQAIYQEALAQAASTHAVEQKTTAQAKNQLSCRVSLVGCMSRVIGY